MNSLLSLVAITSICLAACSPQPPKKTDKIFNQSEVDAAIAKGTSDEVSEKKIELELAEAMAEAERRAAKPAPKTSESTLVNLKELNLCWQDYCPCEPPQGGADAMLCRQLKDGQNVDGEVLAGASGMRDVRKQMKEYEDRYGAF
jgi:hypothetical protein